MIDFHPEIETAYVPDAAAFIVDLIDSTDSSLPVTLGEIRGWTDDEDAYCQTILVALGFHADSPDSIQVTVEMCKAALLNLGRDYDREKLIYEVSTQWREAQIIEQNMSPSLRFREQRQAATELRESLEEALKALGAADSINA